jgi:hypothetical protein
MKIDEILNKLCNHEISKQQAKELIKHITDSLRNKNCFEFTIEEISFNCHNFDGFLKIKMPYGFAKMDKKFKTGDLIDVNLVY